MSDRCTVASLVAFIVIAIGFLCLLPNQMLADEYVHWPQALRFAHGDWLVDPWLSTWPTMNFAVSLLLRLFQSDQLWVGRLTIIAFAVLAYVGFVQLIDALHEPSPQYHRVRGIMALQWFTCPLLLLFCTVVYTDIPALAALIWAAVGVAERRRGLFLIAGIATVAFRQTHLLWFATLLAWHLLLAWRAQTANIHAPTMARLISLVRGERLTLIVSATAVLAWFAVVVHTGAIAFGVNTQPAHHMSVGGVPNEFFAMVVWMTAFAPIAIGTLATLVTRQFSRRETLITVGVAAIVAVLASVFFVTTQLGNTHPSAMILIRNQALQALTDPFGRPLLIALCAAGALVWWRIEFAPSVAPFKWPFFLASASYLLPFSLIEQRYYLPMFTLLAAFRVPLTARWEWAQLAWSLALSSVLLYHVIYKGRFL